MLETNSHITLSIVENSTYRWKININMVTFLDNLKILIDRTKPILM